MKRQHSSSVTNSSGRPKTKDTKVTSVTSVTSVTPVNVHKEEFVAKWIAKLPDAERNNNHVATIDQNNNNNCNNNYNKNNHNNQDDSFDTFLIDSCELNDALTDSTGLTNAAKMPNERIVREIMSDCDNWAEEEFWRDFQLSTLIDYPADTVTYGIRFEEFPVEAMLKNLSSMQIAISDFIKPFHFYFLCSKMRPSFAAFNKELKSCYDELEPQELSMKSCHIFPGQICVANTGKSWARGVITTYLLGRSIDVFLVDLGVEISITAKRLKYLKTAFMKLPRQSIRATLPNIFEKDGISNSELRNFFRERTFGKNFTATIIKIVHLQEKCIIHLDIAEIQELLIKKGLTKCCCETRKLFKAAQRVLHF